MRFSLKNIRLKKPNMTMKVAQLFVDTIGLTMQGWCELETDWLVVS